VKSLHEDMEARVLDQGSFSGSFSVSNGVKQGCVLAPTLFSIMFVMLIREAFLNEDDADIYLNYRTDGGVFNLRSLQAKSKLSQILIRELLFADDCAIMTHIFEHFQKLMDCFANAAKRFGLTISLKKTELMLLPRPDSTLSKPNVCVNGTALNVVDKFCYLGSVLQNVESNDNITRRIGAASAASGRLEPLLWNERGIRLSTKVAVYNAVVIATLLHGCESWTTSRRRVRSLDQFHMRCGSNGKTKYLTRKFSTGAKYLGLMHLSPGHIFDGPAMSAECQTAGSQRLHSMQNCNLAPGLVAVHCCVTKTT